jgi:hypothetical protein
MPHPKQATGHYHLQSPMEQTYLTHCHVRLLHSPKLPDATPAGAVAGENAADSSHCPRCLPPQRRLSITLRPRSARWSCRRGCRPRSSPPWHRCRCGRSLRTCRRSSCCCCCCCHRRPCWPRRGGC